MERVAPSQINYDNQLPIAISSKSQRREFFPEGGSIYGPNGGGKPNIVRIPINADSMLDCQNSYLKFELVTKTNTCGLDLPQSFIKRLRILSGGTVLEDIDQYGRLYAGVLLPSQGNLSTLKNSQITGGQYNSADAGDANHMSMVYPASSTVALGSTITMSIQLASGLLNLDKYVPLVLMNAGFTIELEFDVAGSIGISHTAQQPWVLQNFRYVAHLIDLERDFYDRLRMVMEGSGGVLQLAGQTFRHYSGQFATGLTNASINIPARVKSIKSILFRNTVEADISGGTAETNYGISTSPTRGITEFQFRVGAVSYPPNSVKCGTGTNGATISAVNRGESYLELEKAFGHLSNHKEGSWYLDGRTYCRSTNAKVAGASVACYSIYGLDFESFNRSAIENGVNTADRSLPITLELTSTVVALDTTVDVWCLCDAIFYVNLDGTCSVSI